MSDRTLILLGALLATAGTFTIVVSAYVEGRSKGANAACSSCLGKPATYTERGFCEPMRGKK